MLFGINSKLIHVSAEKYEINIKDSNIDFILRILKKADKRNSPKMITNPDSSKSICEINNAMHFTFYNLSCVILFEIDSIFKNVISIKFLIFPNAIN